MAETVYQLRGKKAVVTGADQGIGKAIALRLGSAGCDVAVVYRSNKDGATEVQQQIEAGGSKSVIVQAEISNVADSIRLVEEAAQGLGDLDFLVNNAGVEKKAEFLDVTEKDFNMVIAVNMTGPFFIAQRFAQHLKQAGHGGKIVNISSVHEDLPFPHFTSYCMSKGALKMMTRNLSIELAPLGITINNIAPGAIKTPINKSLLENKAQLDALLKNIPLRRMGEPEDVAGICAFLLSADSDYVTGTTFFVDGGLTWNYTEQ